MSLIAISTVSIGGQNVDRTFIDTEDRGEAAFVRAIWKELGGRVRVAGRAEASGAVDYFPPRPALPALLELAIALVGFALLLPAFERA